MSQENFRPEASNIGVWIAQKEDTGHGLSEEICPQVFLLGEDGYTYVHSNGKVLGSGINGIVVVRPEYELSVIEAALEQPEKNIYLEYVRVDANGEVTNLWDIFKQQWRSWRPERNPK